MAWLLFCFQCYRNTRDLFKSRSQTLEIARQAAASIESNTSQVEGAVSCPKVGLELQTFQRNPKERKIIVTTAPAQTPKGKSGVAIFKTIPFIKRRLGTFF